MKNKQLELAVNHAVAEYQIARQRMALVGGSGSVDNKRPKAWCEYGFPENLTFEMLYSMWRRGGIAYGAVAKVAGNVWKSPPWIVEGGKENNSDSETSAEKELAAIAKRTRLWRAWKEADVRRMVGRYSALLLHFADNKQWTDAVDNRKKELSKVTPVWAGALTPKDIDSDPTSAGYGYPKSWQYQEVSAAGQPLRTVDVHPDRIFIVGDYTANGIGFFEPAYNALVSLEKVEGGSGESFLKNASRQLNINFDKEVDMKKIADTYGVSVAELGNRFREVARDINVGNDVLLTTQGASVNPLVAQVPDPTPTYDVNLQTAAAAMDIPTKILVGQQTGERASTEDREYFNMRCQSKRVEEETDIEDFFAHLARCGAAPQVREMTVMWDDLNEATPALKLANAKTMSEINAQAVDSTAEPFTPEEIRAAAGFEPKK